MDILPHASLRDLGDSPYAAALQENPVRIPFEPALEAEYQQRHLSRVRLRVRIWFALGVGFELFFGIDQFLGDRALTWGTLAHLLVLGPGRVALVALVWTQWYSRFFLRLAPFFVSGVYVTMAVLNAQALANGRVQQLATMVLMLVGVFSFCGLFYRDAIRTGAAMVVGLAVAGAVFGVPWGLLTSSTTVLAITAMVAAVVYRDAEVTDRTSFLEGGLIRELVSRDGLTCLMNRRAFDEHFARLWQHGLRNERSVTVVMIDVDYFKRYNDAHGHQAGDTALRAVGQTLKGFARRPLDLAARYGGEEFALLLYDLPVAQAHYLAEEVRKAVEGLGVPHRAHESSACMTVSVGVATVQPESGRTREGALQLADEALYIAKQRGRNRSVVRGPHSHDSLVTGAFDIVRAQHS